MAELPGTGEGIIERGVRLSQSSIWKFQRRFFEERGVRAWSERVVPTHVTCNAYIADAYARLVMRFLQDCASQPADSPLAIDPEQPVYIVELGAGAGYLAHLFLNKLIEAQQRVSFAAPRICYVATDFTRSNVDFWKKHPCFQPFIEHGLFDVARFDAEEDQTIELEVAGVTLSPGSVANPMVVIANYVFDSITTDVYRISNGVLEEGLTDLRAVPAESANAEDDAEDNPLDQLHIDYDYRPVAAPPYDDPILNQVLSEYEGTLGDTAFPMPVAAVRCLGNLGRLTDNRMVVCAADKGFTTLTDLTGLPDPSLVRHGSLSMMVNFHALGRYLERSQSGFMLANSDRGASLELTLLSTIAADELPETRTGFWETLERVGPLDIYELAGIKVAEPTLDQLLALLRLASYDPITFISIAREMRQSLDDPTGDQLRRLNHALGEVWRLYFPMDDGRDLPFELGFLSYSARQWARAEYFYQHSLRFHGEHPVTYYNLGLCQYQQGQLRRALALFESSLRVSPTYGPARDWKVRVESEIAAGEPLLPQEPASGAGKTGPAAGLENVDPSRPDDRATS